MADETNTGIRPTQPPRTTMPPDHIGDFGEVIQGARKDLRGNVKREDIAKMTPEERLELVVKNTVWPTPDWETLVREGGYSQKGALLVKLVRDSFPAGPVYDPAATEEQKVRAAQAYNTMVNVAKDVCEKSRTEKDIGVNLRTSPEVAVHLARLTERPAGASTYYSPQNVPADQFGKNVDEAFHGDRAIARDILFGLRCANEGCLDRKSAMMLRRNPTWPEHTSQADVWLRKNRVSAIEAQGGWVIAYAGHSAASDPRFKGYLDQLGFQETSSKVFGIKEEAVVAMQDVAEATYAKAREVSKIKRDAITARALGKIPGKGGPMIDRVGKDWRDGQQTAGEDYLTTFGLRGGQWGNYVPQKMRPELLNQGFDALSDLARALKVPNAAVSFGGHLAIAFGARGRGGNAAAHYEPTQKVMNFTKLNGAGCVAHEVGHAFDHFLGSKATELGLAARTRDPQQAGYLSNLLLKPAGDPSTMTPQEQLLRDLHGRFDSLWLNSDPLTKPEFMDLAENARTKSMTSLMAMVGYAEGFMNQPNVAPEDRARFAELALQVRTPKKGEAMENLTDGIVGMVHIHSLQRSSYSQSLTTCLQSARNSIISYAEKKALPEDHKEVGKPRKTELAKACEKIDGTRSSPYYSLRHEMVARVFEALVADSMQTEEMHNSFLVEGANGEAYPQGQEREKFNKTLAPLIARLPELMPELTVVPPRPEPVTPARPQRELVAQEQMPLF